VVNEKSGQVSVVAGNVPANGGFGIGFVPFWEKNKAKGKKAYAADEHTKPRNDILRGSNRAEFLHGIGFFLKRLTAPECRLSDEP
jgi:hypothetical protein